MQIKTAGVVLLLCSGLAIACQTLPFPVPPIPIKVSVADVAKAMFAGFDASKALRGAAMMKLDEIASTAVGENVWKTNAFNGYFTYSGPAGGANTVYTEKPCGETMTEIELASQESASNGGGGGGGYFDGGGYGGSDPFAGCFTSTETSTGCTSTPDGPKQCYTETWTQLNCP